MADGRCCGFNIGWSYADSMLAVFQQECRQRQLTLDNPQTDEISGGASGDAQAIRQSWWQRLFSR